MSTNAEQFLTAELAHAERQLARVRRIAAQLEQQLAAQGLSELDVYEKLAQSKSYRQLQRDEIVFQQMWLRVHRHLCRLPQPAAEPSTTTTAANRYANLAPAVCLAPHPDLEQTIQDLEREIYQHKPQPIRKPPTPGPNQPCACGSNIKYKKCCGNPLRQHQRAA